MKTDTELKQALAKMLPDVGDRRGALRWLHGEQRRVLDTELLHLCWLVEETLTAEQSLDYGNQIISLSAGHETHDFYYGVAHATWQQRVEALMKIKGMI